MKNTVRALSIFIFALYGLFFAYLATSIIGGFAPQGVTVSKLTFFISVLLSLTCAVALSAILTIDKPKAR
jgi:hypothetical protein